MYIGCSRNMQILKVSLNYAIAARLMIFHAKDALYNMSNCKIRDVVSAIS